MVGAPTTKTRVRRTSFRQCIRKDCESLPCCMNLELRKAVITGRFNLVGARTAGLGTSSPIYRQSSDPLSSTMGRPILAISFFFSASAGYEMCTTSKNINSGFNDLQGAILGQGLHRI